MNHMQGNYPNNAINDPGDFGGSKASTPPRSWEGAERRRPTPDLQLGLRVRF